MTARLLASVLAFALGVGAAWLLPWRSIDRPLAAVFAPERAPRKTAPPPPPEVLEALRALSRAEERYRAMKPLGIDGYASLDDLARRGLVSKELASGTLGAYSIEVTTRPAIPGPVFVARVGQWLTRRGRAAFRDPLPREVTARALSDAPSAATHGLRGRHSMTVPVLNAQSQVKRGPASPRDASLGIRH